MKFSQKISRFGDFEKLSFFELAILNLFLLHPHGNQSQIRCQNGWDSIFFYYDGLQPKMSAGMIKGHEFNFKIGGLNSHFKDLPYFSQQIQIINSSYQNNQTVKSWWLSKIFGPECTPCSFFGFKLYNCNHATYLVATDYLILIFTHRKAYSLFKVQLVTVVQ